MDLIDNLVKLRRDNEYRQLLDFDVTETLE